MSEPFFKRLFPRLLLASCLAALIPCSAHAFWIFGSSDKPAKLIIQPDALELRGASAEHGLLVTAVAADGRTTDVTAHAQFAIKDPKLAVISSNGNCLALADGRTEITISYKGVAQKISITIADATTTQPPSFRQDVIPILTRNGCNQGGCHGKLAGQNGFKLSLRGYAPEWDYEWITKDINGRRLNHGVPEESLFVLKPLAIVPHEGGQRLAEDGRAHRTLIEWIAHRAPGPIASESDASRIEILPGSRTLRVGETQQLLVRAHYPDGRVRDVTWLAKFFSNDDATIEVTPGGVARSTRAGETSVRVHFQGQVEVMTFTAPHDNKLDPSLFAKRNNVVDQHVFAKLAALRLPPSGLCDDTSFLRRASLDTIGTLPTPEEVRSFLADNSADKRTRLIDQLLARSEFADYWTLQFSDLLQNRKERDHDVRGTKGVRSFHSWLRTQIAANRPWNELARDILTASGDSVNRPQIGYYITTIGEYREVAKSEVADSVAQAFLGARIGCARCHNHPLEKYTQDDFYHFAAYFGRVNLKRTSSEQGATELLTTTSEEEEKKQQIAQIEKNLADIGGTTNTLAGSELEKTAKKIVEQRKQLDSSRDQLTKLRAKPITVTQPRTHKAMQPQPLDRAVTVVQPGQDPRELLAAWITDPKNEQFSGAMVNRLWKHFMGAGMVEPVDDLRASNPPSNPELWRFLSGEFVTSGYDLKHVMRLILNSRAYQLSAEPMAASEKDRRFHSHYYARRLPAEVLLDALSQATGVPEQFAGYPVGLRATQLPEPHISSYFLGLFGRSDRVTACACERNGEVTLPQLLHLQNGDGVQSKLRSNESRLVSLLKETSDDARVTETIFLATLCRLPTEAERAIVSKTFAAGGSREEVYGDLFWVLLNSKEFAFNH
ncbi:MAG: DUF1549 domain-containing protein [Pedosphaera sp.]|nr:DUF1549 domain-containing protein [Pedosphaera sp.]